MASVLRQDLELYPASADKQGEPSWTLYDPVKNSFYRLGWMEVEILQLLGQAERLSDAETLTQQLNQHLGQSYPLASVQQFLLFLTEHQLLWPQGLQDRQRLLEQQRQNSPWRWQRLRSNYLFLRVPLLRPDGWLERISPGVQWLFSPLFWYLVAANALLGLFLASRQVDQFFSTFVDFFSPAGLVIFAVALVLTKILHEFGHALAAKRYGCHVPAMGVGFLVFWPVLYTDTTDAWRLQDSRQRLVISGAGIMTELAIASLCLTLWSLLPDGALRGVCFVFATTTWVLTLIVNLNPLLKFDGYFLLNDWLGEENLQPRSFALAGWYWRKWLLGIEQAPPEPPKRWMLFYALACWLYRIALYCSIALVIYGLFFKLLGLVLIALLVFTALLLPLGKLLTEGWSMRDKIRWWPNTAGFVALLLGGLALLVTPWQGQLHLPAYQHAAQSSTLYSAVEGRLSYQLPETVRQVAAGEVLYRFETLDLDYELTQIEFEIRQLRWELQQASVERELTRPRRVVATELSSALSKQAALQELQAKRELVAPFAATISNRASALSQGDWLSRDQALMSLVQTQQSEMIAYLAETHLGQVQVGDQGVFHSSGGTRSPLPATVVAIEPVAVDRLARYYAAGYYGGSLDVREDASGEGLTPVTPVYRLRLVSDQPALQRAVAGELVLETPGRAPIAAVWRRLLGLWRREAGF